MSTKKEIVLLNTPSSIGKIVLGLLLYGMLMVFMNQCNGTMQDPEQDAARKRQKQEQQMQRNIHNRMMPIIEQTNKGE